MQKTVSTQLHIKNPISPRDEHMFYPMILHMLTHNRETENILTKDEEGSHEGLMPIGLGVSLHI